MNKVLTVFVILLFICISVYALKPRSYYSSNHPKLEMVRSNFAKLNPEYAKIPLQEGDSAYTENKAMITLCLVDPDTKTYYDMNTIMYVALHELAHMISKGHGHGDEFKTNFASLLRKAAEVGIYDPRIPIPSSYCKVSA